MTKGNYIYTPRFGNVQIKQVFESETEARKNGYTEPTHYNGEDYEKVLGKSVDVNCMIFAAIKKNVIYYDNNTIYPLADELVNCFSKFLEAKGIMFFNDDSDNYQMKQKNAIYGEDFRTLQSMVQNVLNNRR